MHVSTKRFTEILWTVLSVLSSKINGWNNEPRNSVNILAAATLLIAATNSNALFLLHANCQVVKHILQCGLCSLYRTISAEQLEHFLLGCELAFELWQAFGSKQ